jgi:lysophospholipase L1-like esterase
MDPYGDRLEAVANGDSKGEKTTVVSDGVCGDTTEGIMQRLQLSLGSVAHGHFRHVVLFAGTNDLGMGADMKHIAELVGDGVRASLAAGAERVFLITLPGHRQSMRSRDKRSDCAEYAASCDEFNDRLRALAGGPVHIVDFQAVMPIRDPTLWSDGLHFTGDGYQLLAETVYQAIVVAEGQKQ